MITYRITTGRSRTEKEWKARDISWQDLTGRLARAKRTPETMGDYQKMSAQQRGAVKDVGGFVGGAFTGAQRKASEMKSRSLVTLDIDYGRASTVGVVEDVMAGTAWCLYSTHSHTPRAPRYRLVVPLSREVTPDEYVPIARRMADDIGIGLFDGSTFEPCRLMYWPSCPADADYVFRSGAGEPYDADAALASYNDWRNAAEWPSAQGDSPAGKARQTRMQDPTEKPGVVGAFCREYNIHDAIAAFLPKVYEPTTNPDRYTYTAGSTAQGLVVYDGGLFAFSNHGTDPAFGREVNAFDLVRIHRFGKLDDGTKPDTPVNKTPSYIAMSSFAAADKRVRARMAREKGDELKREFGDVIAGAQDPKSQDEDWMSKMQMDDRGRAFLPSPYNFGLICANDPLLSRCVKRDIFRGRDVVTADLPWRRRDADPFWNNSDDAGLIDYVSRCYRLTSKTSLLDAQDLAVSRRAFHPVRDYLSKLEWDGTPRIDTLLQDYLGAEDNALTRAMTRKHLCAAVARVFHPGVKYDYILSLTGAEGLGKSTLIRTLGGEWFDDSLVTIEGKEGMESLRGKWLVEIGEMTSYKKSTSEAYKAFLSKTEDSFRPAYGRKVEIYPRQCVFFATTNEIAFLKGDTGNRRFWVVECGIDLPAKSVFADLPKERDQIWAEAVTRLRDGEKLYLEGQMEQLARLRQEAHNEVAGDEREGVIREFIRRRLPMSWEALSPLQRREFFRTGAAIDDGDPGITRETISAVELLTECFQQPMDAMTRYRTREINQILRRMDEVEDAGSSRISGYGKQRIYRIKSAKM